MENTSVASEAQMSSQIPASDPLKANARGAAASLGSSVSESVVRGRDAIGAAATAAASSAGSDLQTLQTDINRLKDAVSKFVAEATDEATKSAREVSANVVGRVGDVATDIARRGGAIASTATDQAKTFASEVETMVHRNPVGALAGAVMVGILIGMLGRRS
jgi:ElaB/YqjD/DUF883 family membrane-anchored ribosome-binding protein